MAYHYYAPMWVNDKSIFATVGGDRKMYGGQNTERLVLLDAKGNGIARKVVSRKPPKDPDKDVRVFDEDYGAAYQRKLFPLWNPRIFIVQVRHPTSDGGYDAGYEIDMNKGTFEDAPGASVEGVSPDGLSEVNAEYGWVGGYKGMGAEKLCKLYLWQVKKETRISIGFRLMLCFGACFVAESG